MSKAEQMEPERFDPIDFSVTHPLATPPEIALGVGTLIDSICDLTETRIERVVTPGLSAVTISWATASIPSADWLAGVEDQLVAFAACMGVQVRFRRH